MRIIIKGKGGLKIGDDLKNYVTDKVSKFESLVEEPTICEVTLSENDKGAKRGINKDVHIALNVPQSKKLLYAECRTNDFFASIDLAQNQVEEQLVKYKDKKTSSRFPVKYWVAKMLEHTANGPRWIARKFRKK